jgi:adenylate kinase family enzyme
MRRVAVIGLTSAGKTTLAAVVATLLGASHIELDALHWGPGWTDRPAAEWRPALAERLQAECWVADGNYAEMRDLIWGQADTLVWLDLALPLILWRLFWRTLRRTLSGQELWNGNRESWRGAFFAPDNLFLYAIKSYPRHRRAYPQSLQQPAYRHLRLVRLRTPRQVRRWLASVAQAQALAKKPRYDMECAGLPARGGKRPR